jgi:sensor domain CHASE-containing protein
MAGSEINESEVDVIVLELLKLHSEAVNVDVELFSDLLKHSLSLNTMEKKRVIDAAPTLSQFQFDELSKVFTEEREKFRELAKDHSEWLQLGDLYRAELENKSQEADNKAKEDEIKKSLGL